MGLDKDRCAQQLIETVQPYWEAEGEITRRFFARNPTTAHYEYFLKSLLWKELHPVNGYFNGIQAELAKLSDMFPQLDKGVDRRHYHFLIQQMAEEVNHYVVLAEVLELVLGHAISPDDTFEIPEERKLCELRTGYVQSGDPVQKAAVLLTEGGGSRTFKAASQVGGDEVRDMLAKAMNVIYVDEADHADEAVREAVEVLTSEDDLERMKVAARAVSRQRVDMRLDMFSHPMSQDEVERYIAEQAAALAA